MTLVIEDRVKETAVVTGTADVALAGAQKGFATFGAPMADGDTTYFAISDGQTGDWEIQCNSYSAEQNSLSRAAGAGVGVLSSSNGGALVAFGGHACDVYMMIPSALIVQLLGLLNGQPSPPAQPGGTVLQINGDTLVINGLILTIGA
jgi:hypothetical protein